MVLASRLNTVAEAVKLAVAVIVDVKETSIFGAGSVYHARSSCVD